MLARRRISVEGVTRYRPGRRGGKQAGAGNAKGSRVAGLRDRYAEALAGALGWQLSEAARHLLEHMMHTKLLPEPGEVGVRLLDPVEEPLGAPGMSPPAISEVLIGNGVGEVASREPGELRLRA